MPLIENRLKLLAKSVLIPLGLTAAAAATNAVFHKKMFRNTTLLVSNEEMNDIMKIIKFLEESGLLIKVASKTIKNKAKKQGGFLRMLLGTLGASLSGNLLADKDTIRTGEETIRAGGGRILAGQGF